MSTETQYTDADCIADTGGPCREPFRDFWTRKLDRCDSLGVSAVYLFECLNHPGVLYIVETNEHRARFLEEFAPDFPREVSASSAYMRGTFSVVHHHITNVPGWDDAADGPVEVKYFWDTLRKWGEE